jgi:hypothetical protein
MAAYIIVEQKTIWFWQATKYFRDGWIMLPLESGPLRYRVERCIG